MALTERLSVKRKSSSRTSSQSSAETEPNSCDRYGAKSVPCQSPLSLAQIISSTFKHSPNLLIPDPAFLRLLKTVGAKGERFVRDTEVYTVQQLCFYLKEYIKQRQLYDVNDVQMVYCRGDPLGDVFHMDRFTIYDVLDLISKTSTPLLLSPSKNKMSITSDSKSGDLVKVKQGGVWKTLDDSLGVAAGCTENHGNESSTKRSASSVNLSRIFCRHDDGRGDEESPCNVVTSTTDSVGNAGLKRSLEEEELDRECTSEKKTCLGKSSGGAQQDSFDADKQQIDSEASELRLSLRVKDDTVFVDDFSDVESTYSIQSKETAVVKDSSDDLWFLKEDDDVEYDTDDYREIYADEYDIVSDLSHGSSSEVDDDDFDDDDVFTEREDVIATRDGSETEFADGELSDVEEEQKVSQASGEANRTSWQCIKCCHRNRVPDRLCDECLTLRTEELHQAETSSASVSCKPLTPLVTSPVSEDHVCRPLTGGCHRSDQQLLPGFCRSETLVCPRESAGESFNSSPQFTLSQESGFFSVDSEDVATPTTSSSLRDSYAAEKTEVEDAVTESSENKSQDGSRAGQALASSNMCIICLSEPTVASLIHGTSGHQACCYQCACQLKRMRKPCPVCRRPIQKVIRIYVV